MNDKTKKIKPGKLEKIARKAMKRKPTGRINLDDLKRSAKDLGYKLVKD
jgi:hypothetical protein